MSYGKVVICGLWIVPASSLAIGILWLALKERERFTRLWHGFNAVVAPSGAQWKSAGRLLLKNLRCRILFYALLSSCAPRIALYVLPSGSELPVTLSEYVIFALFVVVMFSAPVSVARSIRRMQQDLSEGQARVDEGQARLDVAERFLNSAGSLLGALIMPFFLARARHREFGKVRAEVFRSCEQALAEACWHLLVRGGLLWTYALVAWLFR